MLHLAVARGPLPEGLGHELRTLGERLLHREMDHGTSSKVLTAKLASWCHQERLSATDMLDASSEVTKGKVATVDGQQAVPIVLTKKGRTATETTCRTSWTPTSACRWAQRRLPGLSSRYRRSDLR